MFSLYIVIVCLWTNLNTILKADIFLASCYCLPVILLSGILQADDFWTFRLYLPVDYSVCRYFIHFPLLSASRYSHRCLIGRYYHCFLIISARAPLMVRLCRTLAILSQLTVSAVLVCIAGSYAGFRQILHRDPVLRVHVRQVQYDQEAPFQRLHQQIHKIAGSL